jgi:hypothetical protein
MRTQQDISHDSLKNAVQNGQIENFTWEDRFYDNGYYMDTIVTIIPLKTIKKITLSIDVSKL